VPVPPEGFDGFVAPHDVADVGEDVELLGRLATRP
jgi:hypothetical protein